jgi:hypothetical protein
MYEGFSLIFERSDLGPIGLLIAGKDNLPAPGLRRIPGHAGRACAK